MSNLLNEAIVDATALRNAALKNAESVVIEKYSEEVKNTLEQLLEQEELGFDAGAPVDPAAAIPDPMADPLAAPGEEGAGSEEVESLDEEDDIPLAATNDFGNLEGKNLGKFPATGEDVEISIDLGALQEAVNKLSEDEEVEINEEELAALLEEEEEDDEDAVDAATMSGTDSAGIAAADQEAADAEAMEDKPRGLGETVKPVDRDALVDAIVERLTVDMGADLSGWAGRSSEDIKYALSRALAHRRSTDVEDELQIMKKAHEELVFENRQLTEQHSQYKQAFQELKENLQDVNLSNARLLYTNRVLRNISFNERQKTKIVEAISSAGSVTEARTIYDTLQSTVEASTTRSRSPQSLSEAIGRRSSVIRASRATEAPSSDPHTERMKKLAGII
tara:strand:+ start:818 stop:1996 length:1179 start_codon:yes stop_codon:yes gene_type:complete